MSTTTNLGAQFLANPEALQNYILQDLTNVLNGQPTSIPSASSPFCALLNASVMISSQFVSQENSKFNALYAQRATTGPDLYPFLSDYDYINFTAKPVSLAFKMMLNKQWILANAVPYNTYYSLLRIPATARVQLGTRSFGIYYPIDIQVNNTNHLISVYYNVQTVNPLMTYASNTLQDVGITTLNGLETLHFVFNTWQFDMSEAIYTVSLQTGFNEIIEYQNQFYAARVYYQNSQDGWTEMAYSFSQMMYNQNTPTAILTLNTSENTVTIKIPQIYFNNNQVSQNIKVQLYTTEGYINEPISEADASTCQIYLDPDSNKYSAPFLEPDELIILPNDITTLVGGSNAQSLISMKNQIISGSLYKSVPISQSELTAMVSNYGFNLSKYLDNITDRIYYATSALTLPNGNPVPVVVAPVIYDQESLNGSVSTILSYDNNLYTVLPTTVFSYSSTTNSSVPLTDSEVNSLNGMETSSLISYVNQQTHTRQPFHQVLDTSAKYPTAMLFDLMSPTATSMMFLSDNASMAAQLSVIRIEVTHLQAGTGGYSVKAGVSYTAVLKDTPKDQQSLFFFTTDKTGKSVYFQVSYLTTITTGTEETNATMDVYAATLPTNYSISTDGYICLYLTDDQGQEVESFVSLSQTWYIVGCVSNTTFSDPEGSYSPPYVVPSNILLNWIPTSQQSVLLTLGENLDQMFNSNVNTTWGEAVFQTYNETVYKTYSQDVYLKDANGNYVVEKNPSTGTVELVLLHQQGDNVLSGQNLTVTISETPLTTTSTIPVTSVFGVLVGSPIRGPGIPVGTTVVSVDEATNSITLSNTPSSVTQGTQLILPTNFPSGTVVSVEGDTLTLSSTTDFLVGMTIVGLGIPQNTLITAVTDTTLTLSNTLTVQPNAYVYAFNANGPFEVLHQQGDTVLNSNGQPIQLVAPSNVYGVDTIQFDSKLYMATDSATVQYCQNLPALLTANAAQLNTVRGVLLERTQLYYKPLRSVGQAIFSIGNNQTIEAPLGISLTVTYYVEQAVAQNVPLCNEITSLTISSIGTYLTSNRTYSTQDIVSLLTQHFETNVISMAISGFWNNSEYQFMSISDDTVIPCLAYSLKQTVANTIELSPNITVIFSVTPVVTAVSPLSPSTVPTTPALSVS